MFVVVAEAINNFSQWIANLTGYSEVIAVALVAILIYGSKNWVATRLKNAVKAEYERGLVDLKQMYARDLQQRQEQHDKNIRIFEERMAALRNLSIVLEDLLPEKTHPEMEWIDAMRWVAGDFELTKGKLDKLAQNYGAFLPGDVNYHLAKARSICADGKFKVEKGGGEVHSNAEEMADNLYDELNAASAELRKLLFEEAGMEPPSDSASDGQ